MFKLREEEQAANRDIDRFWDNILQIIQKVIFKVKSKIKNLGKKIIHL